MRVCVCACMGRCVCEVGVFSTAIVLDRIVTLFYRDVNMLVYASMWMWVHACIMHVHAMYIIKGMNLFLLSEVVYLRHTCTARHKILFIH